MKKLFILSLFLSTLSLSGQDIKIVTDTGFYQNVTETNLWKKKKKNSDSKINVQLSENYPPNGMVRTKIKDWNYKRSLLGFSAGLIGGASWGLHETINYHYSSFKRVHPGADDQWWNPEVSWQNKNTSSLPLSRSLFVFFTDAKHGLAGLNTLSLVGGTCIVTIGEKRKWWEYLIDLGVMSAGRSIGFYTVYNVIYK